VAKIYFRRHSRKIFLAAILSLIILVSFYSINNVKDPETPLLDKYRYLASLPAEFVHQCKTVELKSEVPWELLAAYYQVSIDDKFISNYPNSVNIERLVNVFKQSNDLTNIKEVLGFKIKDKNLIRKIEKRYELLKENSYIFTSSYEFPIKEKKLFYKDTWGEDRDEGKRAHLGTDIFAPEGTPIYSISDGVIEKIGWNSLGGKRIGVRGTDGLYYYYAHLQDFVPNLKAKDTVKKGTLIGYVGKTGNAIKTPPHLHLGIDISKDQWINPYNLLSYWQQYGGATP
jgi:peptidoglycan LD-endopeptidase LytH